MVTIRFVVPLMLAAIAAVPELASTAVYVVQPDGAGDFLTIQAAVDAAVDGDAIELANGTFRGPGNRDVDYRGKEITIQSQSGNPETCIVDCEGSLSDPHRGFRFASGEGSGAVLEGITIINGYGSAIEHGFRFGGAIYCRDASPTIRRCRLLDNDSDVGGAIGCASSSARIEDCTLAHNRAEIGGGVGLTNGNALIAGCTLVGNAAPDGSGIFFIGDIPPPTLTIENTVIAYGVAGEAVQSADFGWKTYVSCSNFYGNEGGDWVGEVADQVGVDGNISADPLFCNAQLNDFHLNENSPCAPDANPECGLIGAWPVACSDPIAVHEATWGEIKMRFRPEAR